jgi:hypothetical protein
MNLDEYQIQHAKNFQYRYYPPRLVELERSHMQNHEGNHGHYAYESNYRAPDEADHGAGGHNHDHAYNQYAHASTKAGATLVKWAIILLVLLLALFLILGVVGMQGSSGSSGNAGKAGGGRGR